MQSNRAGFPVSQEGIKVCGTNDSTLPTPNPIGLSFILVPVPYQMATVAEAQGLEP